MEEARHPKNSWRYMVEDIIIAGMINPDKYKMIAKDKILSYSTNFGWSKDVVGNLRKLGFSDNMIKNELMLIVEREMLKPSEEDEFTNRALVLPLKEL